MIHNPHPAGARAGGSTRHGAARRNTRPRHTDQLVLKFDASGEHLAPQERVVLQRWIGRWLVYHPQGVVVMAHTASRRASGRRGARLRALRETVQSLGVARENVKYTDRPVHPAEANYGPDAVVMKFIDPPEEGQPVRSVANCFDSTTQPT